MEFEEPALDTVGDQVMVPAFAREGAADPHMLATLPARKGALGWHRQQRQIKLHGTQMSLMFGINGFDKGAGVNALASFAQR